MSLSASSTLYLRDESETVALTVDISTMEIIGVSNNTFDHPVYGARPYITTDLRLNNKILIQHNPVHFHSFEIYTDSGIYNCRDNKSHNILVKGIYIAISKLAYGTQSKYESSMDTFDYVLTYYKVCLPDELYFIIANLVRGDGELRVKDLDIGELAVLGRLRIKYYT